MICTKCNTDNKTVAKFCYKCGAPFPVQQNVLYQISDNSEHFVTEPQPAFYDAVPVKSNSKRVVLIVILIIVAAVAVVSVLVLNAYMKAPRNAMAAMYDGYNNLLASEGFDIRTTTTIRIDEETQTYQQNLSVLFGEDTASSVFEMSQETPWGWQNVAFTGDRLIMGAWYDYSYWWGEEGLQPGSMDDPYNYWVYETSDREIRDLFAEAEDLMYDLFGVSVKLNSLVLDHRLNTEQIIKYGNQIAGSPNRDLEDILDDLGISRIPNIEEIQSIFEYFVYTKCEEKGFAERFILDANISKSSFDFKLDIGVLLDEFGDFLEELEEDEKALSQIEVRESSVRDMRRAYRLLTRELNRDPIWKEMNETIVYKVGLQLDENRVLKTMNISIEAYIDGAFFGGESAIEVTKVNGSKINIEALNMFADKILDYQYGNDPGFWADTV